MNYTLLFIIKNEIVVEKNPNSNVYYAQNASFEKFKISTKFMIRISKGQIF